MALHGNLSMPWQKMQHKKCGMPQESTSSLVWVTNTEGILQKKKL
jgi:hypothetical protein